LKEALGLPVQLVTGYKGVADIRIAAEAGELAGGCWGWDGTKRPWAKQLDAGEVVVVLQNWTTPHPDLPKVPLAITQARNAEARQLIQIGFMIKVQYCVRLSFHPKLPRIESPF